MPAMAVDAASGRDSVSRARWSGLVAVVVWMVWLCAGPLAREATAENWPTWRGPTSDGYSSEKQVPVSWDRDTHVAWKLPLPGPAGSTPIVWNDAI
jgi:hypothetical protein